MPSSSLWGQWGLWGPWQSQPPDPAPLCPRNAYDRHVFRMQKNTRGSRGTWDKVKKKSVMLLFLGHCPLPAEPSGTAWNPWNPGITAPLWALDGKWESSLGLGSAAVEGNSFVRKESLSGFRIALEFHDL